MTAYLEEFHEQNLGHVEFGVWVQANVPFTEVAVLVPDHVIPVFMEIINYTELFSDE